MKIKLNKKEQVALAHLVGNVAWYHNGDIGRLAERLSLEDLAFEVREAMRERGQTWRAANRGNVAPRPPAIRRKKRRSRRVRVGAKL